MAPTGTNASTAAVEQAKRGNTSGNANAPSSGRNNQGQNPAEGPSQLIWVSSMRVIKGSSMPPNKPTIKVSRTMAIRNGAPMGEEQDCPAKRSQG